MPDIAPQVPAPGVEPVAPVVAPVVPAPVAPVEPVAPVVEPTAEEAEQKEWDDAYNDRYGEEKPKVEEPKKDEPTEPQKTAEEIAAEEAAGAETPEQKTEREAKYAPTPGSTERDARIAARNYAKQVETYKADIMTKMFAEVPKTLVDADGDPINGIDDVMKLIDPRTSELFTEDAAGMWLLSAQQKFNEGIANINRQAEQIAEVNIEIKDQADAINEKYGEYLKQNPDERDELWLEFEASLEKDPDTNTITKMPFSLEKFYDRALRGKTAEPVAPVAPVAPGEPEAPVVPAPVKTAEEVAADEAAAKKAAEAKRQAARAERSDIYLPTNEPILDDEEKEWADAHEIVFGDRK